MKCNNAKTFFGISFFFTYLFWSITACLAFTDKNNPFLIPFLFLGLASPAAVAAYFHFSIKNLVPFLFLLAVIPASIVLSVAASTLLGLPLSQLSLSRSFSFSIERLPSLLVLILAAILEEIGWRGYGFKSLLRENILFKASILFAVLWSLWHLPLFAIPGTYQFELLSQSYFFALNFLLSIVPVAFFINWLSIKTNHSIPLASIYHFYINMMQEAFNLNPFTKCLQTIILSIFALILVFNNRKVFFKKVRL